jgi:hypothetical protein
MIHEMSDFDFISQKGKVVMYIILFLACLIMFFIYCIQIV